MRILILLLAIATMTSCSDAIFSESVKFADNRWARNHAAAFDFDIAESGRYDVFIEISHVYGGIPMASFPMELAISGQQSEVFDLDLEVLRDGKQVGDCVGDYCDITVKAATIDLEPGSYKAALSQSFDHEFLPNIIRAGVTVKKAQ